MEMVIGNKRVKTHFPPTPTISGFVALLKALHRNWSPAAIRSAIVTTAWRTDPFGEQIIAEGSPRKLADPFDYGGGLVNPEKATKPGLVYDLGLEDYVLYMCSVGLNSLSVKEQSVQIPNKLFLIST
ncbi:PREDICTED: subtilisin-like protease SBT3.8 [Camelina sativa]|uniref:Subtilisin-like protease SBT3.8 n=1 Tax=Camelina sativa TaxID=90675 RepID=A0ABM0TD22_CAMSA|nr:PREDICTED: subtilisin-like protease SBT3.8 [Camelina sativa]